jgi:hypothetical protein
MRMTTALWDRTARVLPFVVHLKCTASLAYGMDMRDGEIGYDGNIFIIFRFQRIKSILHLQPRKR